MLQIDFNEIVNKDGFVVSKSLDGASPATAANYGVIFIAPFKCAVVQIDEVHTTAGTNGGAVTLNVERLQGTEALDAGDALLSTAFNLKGIANTVQNGALVANSTVVLEKGDRLALKDSGTLTDVAGVCVTVKFIPIGKGHYL